MKRAYYASKKGIIIIGVLTFGTIAVLVTGALLLWAAALFRDSRVLTLREEAFQIAESGIDYYRWHLAHSSADYKDGTSSSGPYVHDFKNKDGEVVGQFTLTITPPLLGSTVVKIRSQGTVSANPTISRTLEVTLAIPSIAKYAMVSNSVVYYGSGDEVFGPVHSNAGIGFLSGNPQPIAHNIVTASVSTLNPGNHFGVYTSVSPADPTPPAAVPNRPDVFQGGRQFPVPVVDFSGITTDLSVLKTQAQSAGGFYRGGSGVNGYKIVLKTNGTFDLYSVNSLLTFPGCTNSANQTGWGIWSVGTTGGATTLLGNYAFPANGIMFFEDHIWVEGKINGARMTIAAGKFPVDPTTYKNIIVNNDLTYTNFDGTDTIGLIAQGNFLVGMASADNLTIDGALIAQNGATIRFYYGNCGTWNMRNTLTTFGMFATNGGGYFYYGSSGYSHQIASYDTNLLYAPPPNFPLTSNQYTTLSWKEVK